MTLLQCMILFAVIFGGQIVAFEYTFGGSDPIRTRGKPKQTLLEANFFSQQKKDEETICLYVDNNNNIFHKYHEQTYKVLNFAIFSRLFTMPIQETELLPIYYGNRLGLILEKVEDKPGIVNSQTKSRKPPADRKSVV